MRRNGSQEKDLGRTFLEIGKYFPDNFRTRPEFPDSFRSISGQFLDNFRFRRIPADAGGFRRKGNRVFVVFSRVSEIPARRFRRIPADDQKSARNQTRNQSRNQKLSRNYFRKECDSAALAEETSANALIDETCRMPLPTTK